jgi:hypothetical protein
MSKFERDFISRPNLFHGRISEKMGTWILSLPGFAGSVAPVAFSLAGGLVFDDARYPGIFRRPSRLDLGCRCCRDGCLLLGSKSVKAGTLLDFQSFPFRTARFSGFNK